MLVAIVFQFGLAGRRILTLFPKSTIAQEEQDSEAKKSFHPSSVEKLHIQQTTTFLDVAYFCPNESESDCFCVSGMFNSKLETALRFLVQ